MIHLFAELLNLVMSIRIVIQKICRKSAPCEEVK